MTLKFLISIIAFALILQFANAQFCHLLDTDAGTVNVEDLTKKVFEATGSDGTQYKVKICNSFQLDAPPQCSGGGRPHGSFALSGSSCAGIGQYQSSTKISLIDPTAPDKGVTLLYDDGDMQGITPTATKIDLICDPSGTSALQCANADCKDMVGNKVQYHFAIKTSAACPGSGGRPFLFPVGVLGIFLILSIFGFILYWPIGIVVNKFIRKKEGIEMVPNVHFWKDLPFLTKDGFLFLFKDLIYEKIIAVIIEKIKSRRGSYESA